MPYGAPTHHEVLDVLTPQAYRSPAVRLLGLLAVAAAQQLWQMQQEAAVRSETRRVPRAS